MRRRILLGTLVILVAGASLGAYAFNGRAARTDCPGRIVCPLTGDLVCRDLCPRVDPGRPDCPGRIECPESGELVCRDRCPIQADAPSVDLPACCAGKE